MNTVDTDKDDGNFEIMDVRRLLVLLEDILF